MSNGRRARARTRCHRGRNQPSSDVISRNPKKSDVIRRAPVATAAGGALELVVEGAEERGGAVVSVRRA
jgi:hypothetical protein